MKKTFCILLILITASGIKAQEETNYGWWTEFGTEKEIANNLDVELSEEIRYFFDLGEIDKFKTNLGLTYKISSRLRFGLKYSWTYNHDTEDDFYAHRHRITVSARMKEDVGRFEISLLEKLQFNYYDTEKEDVDYSPKTNLRSLLKIAYNLTTTKIEPFIQAQFRYQLNNPDGNEFDNSRFATGISFPLSNKLEMDTFLQLDKELNRKSPDKIWILGTNLKFEW
jgi:hypothetical protein